MRPPRTPGDPVHRRSPRRAPPAAAYGDSDADAALIALLGIVDCTLSMARRLDPKGPAGPDNHKLDTLAARYRIEQLNHHDAGDDALVGAHLALHLLAMDGGAEAFQRAKLK